jgi:DNA-binding response OmpR family regulator
LFVNGNRIVEPLVLQDGDRIQIAPHYQLTFVDSEATAPVFHQQSGVVVNESTRRVWVQGVEVNPPLSIHQFVLLNAFVNAPGRVFSRDDLIPIAWPDEDPSGISDEAVNSLIRRLRLRLTNIDASHRYIFAVRGHGFRFEQP